METPEDLRDQRYPFSLETFLVEWKLAFLMFWNSPEQALKPS